MCSQLLDCERNHFLSLGPMCLWDALVLCSVNSDHLGLPRHHLHLPSPECPLGQSCLLPLSTQQAGTSLRLTSFVPCLLQITVLCFLMSSFLSSCVFSNMLLFLQWLFQERGQIGLLSSSLTQSRRCKVHRCLFCYCSFKLYT